MRKYLLSGLGVVAVILTLQAALPHRLEEGRSTEVLGKMNHYLKWRPAGLSLAEISDSFAWDEACVVKENVLPEEFALQSGVALPGSINLGQRVAWLLVFAKDGKAVAVAEVPPQTIGAIDLDQPWACVADQNAFFQVIELDEDGGPPRRLVLRT